jgi:two-component system sensor kinase FixL
MAWIDIAWPMLGAISLTLGVVHLLVWIRQPAQYAYLLFFVTAVMVAVFTVFELRMMRAADPGEYAAALRWAHVPVLFLFASFVGFVLLYLCSRRWWLGAAAFGTRALSLALNFSTGVNLNWLEVTAMVPVQLWGGESVYAPVGVPNPAMVLGQLSNLLLVAFVVDASVTSWRLADPVARRRTMVVGGSLILFPLLGSVHAALLIAGLVNVPTTLSALFLLVVLAMAYELGSGVLEAAKLAERLRLNEDRLRESEQRLQLAASAGDLGLWEWTVTDDEVWMTPESRALFGYDPEEPLGLERFLAGVHADDRPAVERGVRAALGRDDGNFEQDFRIVLPDGGVRWVRSRGRVEHAAAGNAVRMRGVSQDVTARKHAEAEAVRRRDELAHLARVSMLGELSGSLAHELNQPLSAIVSNAQAAQRFLAREPMQMS